ncbi:uncharacterized protein LY79DRAFT_530694, partial [Colletotrichum navitas]
KNPPILIFRGGLSPRVAPVAAREMDTFVTLTTERNPQLGVARFNLKAKVPNGVSEGKGVPLGGVTVCLHQQYAKLLLTAGVDHCVA